MTTRRVLVTGGSRGIGEAIVARYRAAGCDVLAPSRHELDLGSVASIRSFLSGLGALDVDVLVNNAGENRINALEKIALADWEAVQAINVTAPFLLVQDLAPRMAARAWGRIVNISSCYGVVSRPGRASYGVTKAGLNSLTRTAALEFGARNVLVNAVCPGFVMTDMTRRNNSPEQIESLRAQVPTQRLALPEEIAEFVFFLGSDLNTYITGQSILIDGGFSVQ